MMTSEARSYLFSGWLGGIDQGLAETVLSAGKPRHLADGQPVFAQGDEEQGIFGIASGHVRMFFTMNEQDPLLGHVAGPGFWFGEVALVIGTGRLMGAAASGSTELWFVSLPAIKRIATSQPEVWRAIARLAALNQALAIGAAEDLLIRDSRQRLAAVLLRLANMRSAYQGGRPFRDVPVTQSELAEAACMSRTAATEILRSFSRMGLIANGYRSIRILEPEHLSTILHG